jgi:TetR/AcrR family transcriptional regulator, ethionamide resistance regulator
MRSVTRRSPSSSQEPNSGAIEKIVAAFERLLARGESFTTISVEKLASEAGIVRATYYLHFRNKGELVGHLMKNVSKELRSAASEALNRGGKFGRTEFQTFMRSAVEIHFQHRSAIRAMVEVSAYDPKVAKIYQEFWETQAADTRIVLERLKSKGKAHPDAVPEIADMVTWTAERSCTQMLDDTDTIERRHQVADMLTHVVWSAIALPDQ